MNLFTEHIPDWEHWGKIFQSIPLFTLLVKHIMQKENLPFKEIKNLKPGTNAVFKVGNYVVKIFAPPEFDDGYGTNVDVELFGMKWANAQGVSSPKLISYGAVDDKYCFKYIIMEYIEGELLGEIEDNLSYDEKVIIGQKMRKITDKLNTPCGNFTDVDIIQYSKSSKDWNDEGFPDSFQVERLAYLAGFHIDECDKVYCHGDLHVENILVYKDLNVYIIDFADAMFAPKEYEQAYVASGLFCFEKPYMKGYFGEYTADEIVDLCMTWLPVHAWGYYTVGENLKPAKDITSFAVMKKRLYKLLY